MNPSSHPPFEPAYLSFLDEIYHCHWSFKKKQKIQRLKDAIRFFWPDGHPSRLIQVTGTNGKGSVSRYLECGFGLQGKTGSWTGPHLFDYAERFHIQGVQVSHREIVEVYRQDIEPYQQSIADSLGGQSLGFASLGILIALKLFERHRVDWAILEVGAGGRYTPLMALDVAACVLTNVGNDHPVTLGSELWQRALEKAGIARKQVPFFSSEMREAREFVRRTVADEEGLLIEVASEDCTRVRAHCSDPVPAFVSVNMALAVKVVQHFFPELDEFQLVETMGSRLKGRFWLLEGENTVVDVAHNRDKIQALVDHLQIRFPGKKMHFLLGLTRQRDALDVFEPILPLASSILFTSASYPGQDPSLLAAQFASYGLSIDFETNPADALSRARKSCGPDDILVVTGSAYMVDQALNSNPYLAHTNASFGWRGSGSTGTL